MLSQKHRFHRRNQLAYVHRKGHSLRGDQISLRFLNSLDNESYRVAVVVSRKVSKKAVTRNRIRRRVYEIIRTLDPPLRNDVDLIISVFDDSVAEMEHSKLSQELTALIDRAGIRDE